VLTVGVRGLVWEFVGMKMGGLYDQDGVVLDDRLAIELR